MINKETIAMPVSQLLPRHVAVGTSAFARRGGERGCRGRGLCRSHAQRHRTHGSTIRPFLMTAVRNRCINILRSRSIRQRIQGLYLLDSQLDTASADDIEERIGHMRQAFDSSLDDNSRRVLTQRYIQQPSYAEIAAEESISETAVYKRIRKALDTLRKKLTRIR